MNYAIVNIQGKQLKLTENKYVYVPHISINLKEKIFLNEVLFFYEDGSIKIGDPFLKDVNVQVKILEHIKGKKIIIFKKKRRKGYKVKNGFRPFLTKIQVISIKIKNGS
ncbi:50S ribosomal protein L21 [Blattabacterium cuenoti]|nr:50S ribosomal protein L21 [Blattabacterium cuenoti]